MIQILLKFLLLNCFLNTHFICNGHEDNNNSLFAMDLDSNLKFGQPKPARYILYDVNIGEGFNLRRDVYIRMANMIKLLEQFETFILVLPPWNRMYHWRSDIKQTQIPWSTFFDLDSFRKHISVIEFHEFLNATGTKVIDEVYYLQRYKEGWNGGKWEEKFDERPCLDKTYFEQKPDGYWHWWFWGFDDIVAKDFKCISVQADYNFFKDMVLNNTTGRAIMFHRAEQLIHGKFSEWSYEFWTARRSMRFALHLRDIASEFRLKYLDSNDVDDRTTLKEDWTKMKRKEGHALGGPYLAIHLRRRDFTTGHADKIPSIKGAAKQIEEALIRHNLTKVFIATDGEDNELLLLKKYLKKYEVYNFEPTEDILQKYKDGGMAIIDQIICSHARWFIGTYFSTFSYRIQEERQLLGFYPDSTYNRFCPDEIEKECEHPSQWKVIYKKQE